jgi:hypothetical protein
VPVEVGVYLEKLASLDLVQTTGFRNTVGYERF